MSKNFRSRSDDPETTLIRHPMPGMVSHTKLPFPPPLELLTVKETAALLRVCIKTVHRLKNEGKLKHSRVGRQIRISRQSINVCLNLTKDKGG